MCVCACVNTLVFIVRVNFRAPPLDMAAVLDGIDAYSSQDPRQCVCVCMFEFGNVKARVTTE